MALLIVDLQNAYRSHMAKDLVEKVRQKSAEFSEVYYLWDTLSGNDLYSEIPEEWMEDEEFYNQLNLITKEYGFFRSLMDLGLDADDELLLKLLSFMSKHNVYDCREILDQEELYSLFKEEFKKTSLMEINLNDYPVSLPLDLMEELEKLPSNIYLVGGGRNECLKEVYILLKHMGKKPSIIEDLTY